MRKAWYAGGLRVRSTEYSTGSTLEDFTTTHQVDDPSDPPVIHLMDRLSPGESGR